MSVCPVSKAELVVHVFVTVDGERADDTYSWLRALWEGAKERLDMEATNDPPAERTAAARHHEPLLAFAGRDDDRGIAQALIRRSNDVLVLSVVDAPGGLEQSWRGSDGEWDAIVAADDHDVPRPGTGVLGVVRIYQGESADLNAGAELAACAAAVQELVPGARTEPPWEEGGCRIESGLAVWDVGAVDDLLDRRLVVLSPTGGDATMSSWTWVVGPSGMTPLTRYLLHTAKIRYSRTVLEPRTDAIRRACAAVELETRTVLDKLDGAELTSADQDVILDLLVRCNKISLDLARLDDLRRQLRGLRRTVEIAVANRLRCVPETKTPGANLFDDDRIDGDVLSARIGDELEYLDAVREGGRDVHAAVHAAADRESARLERERQARQDRFSLLQTAVIGVLVMVLTAVQSLEYHGPLDARVHPALIALLGAVALALGVEMLGRAQPDDAVSARMRWARAVCVGLCGAAAGWLIETLVRVQILDHGADARLSCLGAGMGFLLLASAVVAARRPGSRLSRLLPRRWRPT